MKQCISMAGCSLSLHSGKARCSFGLIREKREVDLCPKNVMSGRSVWSLSLKGGKRTEDLFIEEAL